jgi:hypothetical protein
MGAWGTGVFSDDNAADVRDDYRKLVGDGLTGPQATERLIAQWAPIGDPDLEPVFWLALALTQWGCGRLEARVKEEALRMIANGSAIRAWAGGPDERKRRTVLEAAKRKLESPQPTERKIKARPLATCEWGTRRPDWISLDDGRFRCVANARSACRSRRRISGVRAIRLARA